MLLEQGRVNFIDSLCMSITLLSNKLEELPKNSKESFITISEIDNLLDIIELTIDSPEFRAIIKNYA